MKSYTHVVFLLLFVCSFKVDVLAQKEGDIRLNGEGSNSTHGRVEIYHENQWGTVCDDAFGLADALIACKQLGHSKGVALKDSGYGPGTGPIWMDDVVCEATEQRLVDCPFGGWNNSDCSHLEDVAVACVPVSLGPTSGTTLAPTVVPVVPETGNCTVPDPTIRLQSPENRRGMGAVQIFRNNAWGGICDNSWDTNDAMVVCRMLCYNPSDALPGNTDSMDMSKITEPMVVNSMNCAGTENNISDCAQSPWALNSCGRNEMATVTCIPITYSPVRPEPSLRCTEGLLTAGFSTVRDPYLERKHLTVAHADGVPCNTVYGQTATEVTIGLPFDECNTTRSMNATHIIYDNTVRYASTYTSANGQITHANTYMIKIRCSLPRDVIADKPIVPVTETVTQSAPGEFVVTLQFYRNNSFSLPVTQFPLEIPLGEWLSAALLLSNVDSSLRLVVHNCTATPTANKDDPIRYPLFIEKCIEDPTIGFFPLNDTWFAWRYQTFKFVEFSEVHLHCDALVCGQEETDPICDRSCFQSAGTSTTTSSTTTSSSGNVGPTGPAGRKKRSAGRNIRSFSVSSSTIIVYDPEDPVLIERPVYTVLPESEVTKSTQSTVITGSSKHAPPQTSSWPITTKKPPVQANQSPTASSVPISQTPPPVIDSENSDHTEEGAIIDSEVADLVGSNVFSTASVFMFSLFSLTQFTLCMTLFYMLF